MKYSTELYVTLWLSNVSVKFWSRLRFFTCTDCGLWNHLQKIRGWKSATGSNKCNTRWVLLKVARTFNVLSLQTNILYPALTAVRFKNKSDFFFQVTVAKHIKISTVSAYNIVSVTFSPIIEIVPSWSFWSTKISYDKLLLILEQISTMLFLN